MALRSPAARSLVQRGRTLASAMVTWAGAGSARSDLRTVDVDDLILTAAQLTAAVASHRRNRDSGVELARDAAAVAAVAASLLRRRWTHRFPSAAESFRRPEADC